MKNMAAALSRWRHDFIFFGEALDPIENPVILCWQWNFLLHQYANEAAWREDNRRKPNGTNWNTVIGAALAGPKSPVWTGYWHRSAA